MLKIVIPCGPTLALQHLVLDFNGTLAVDGGLLPGVSERLIALSESLQIHVVTADTFQGVHGEMKGLPCRIEVLGAQGQDLAKEAYVQALGAATVVAVGNGRNDYRMLKAACLGMVLIQGEGAATEAFLASDLVLTDIRVALDLLLYPRRLEATLRT